MISKTQAQNVSQSVNYFLYIYIFVSTQGAALCTMVGYLTYGNKKFADLDAEIRSLLPSLYSAMKETVPYIDADTTAFNQYSVRL